MTLDGPVTAAHFTAFVRQILRPRLQRGDLVVLDNLSSHKSPTVRDLVEQAGAGLWFLPPYSPDLNPIEPAFSKLRRLYRSAAHRTRANLWGDTQRMLDAITPQDAQGFFRHCGYANAT